MNVMNVVSWVSSNIFDNITYTVRNGLNRGLKRKGGLGWLPIEHHQTPEALFWKSLNLCGKVIYDIGAFHGLLTIHFAQTGRLVVAWEPNSLNRKRLTQNIDINHFSNVIVRPYGLSSKNQQATMIFDSLTAGRSSCDSTVSIVSIGNKNETIELRILDDEASNFEHPNLIKIDVEGLELDVLKGATETLKFGPALFIEMHGSDMNDKCCRVRAIVDFLLLHGYQNILHIETQTQITAENAIVAAQGHLYALYKGSYERMI